MAHLEPPHQDLRCLQIQLFSSLVFRELRTLHVLFRKQKTDNTEEADSGSSSLESYVDGLFFNKDESNLQEMIDIIPPGIVFRT